MLVHMKIASSRRRWIRSDIMTTEASLRTESLGVGLRLKDTVIKLKKISKNEKPFLVKSFGHQVSGRATMLSYNSQTICKPYVSRELYFYYFLPSVLKPFAPEFRGMLNIVFIENSRTGSVLTYAQPKSLLRPKSRDIAGFVEEPKPHSKRCVRDFGKTHVIFPSSLSAQIEASIEVSKKEESADDLEKLMRGFESNVTVGSDDVMVTVADERSVQSSGLMNPWSSQVIDNAWTKYKATYADEHGGGLHATTARTKRFMLLENVTSPYRRPCVLDLKIGTRVRENASAVKLARHVTAIDIGARLSGMQIYCPRRKEFLYTNKYYGHSLSVHGFKTKVLEFFSRGKSSCKRNSEESRKTLKNPKPSSSTTCTSPKVDVNLVKRAIAKLTSLKEAIETLISYRFYSCSVLIIYEGDVHGFDQASKKGLTRKSDLTPVFGSSGDHVRSKSHTGTVTASGKEGKENKRCGDQLDCKDRDSERCSLSTSPVKKSGRKTIAKTTTQLKEERHRRSSETSMFSSRGDHKPPISSRVPGFRKRAKSCSSLHQQKEDETTGNVSQITVFHHKALRKDASDLCEVRLIDYAHFCHQDATVHPGPDGGFLFGLDNVIALLEDMLH